jgi:hypothetical protein
MIVFVAGMPRSGSTFCFNIVRELLQVDGTVHTEATLNLRSAKKNGRRAKHIIIKAHRAPVELRSAVADGSVRMICSVRAVEEAIASWMDTFDFDLEQSIEDFKGWFSMYRELQPHCLTLDYKTIENSPERAVAAIAGVLCSGASTEALARKYSKAATAAAIADLAPGQAGVRDIGFSYYDKTTFYHRRHISSLEPRCAEATMSRNDLERIRSEFAAEIALLESAEVLAPT